jgi:hypothetical protein
MLLLDLVLATPVHTFDLVNLETTVDCVRFPHCYNEPSSFEPLPPGARLLSCDGVNRLLTRLQLLEGAVTSTFDLMRLGFLQVGSIGSLYPTVSEDVAVSHGLAYHDCRTKSAISGSFLAFFQSAAAHFDPTKSWPDELAALRLQHPSICTFDVSPLALLCDIEVAKNHLIERVNPYSFFVELRPRQFSETFVPAVITVDGNVEEMFFSSDMHLTATYDDSSMDGRLVLACCSWLSIDSLPKKRIEEVKPLNDLGLNQTLLQPVDDQVDAFFKSDQVSLKDDFDCSDASLESEGEFNSFECSEDLFA